MTDIELIAEYRKGSQEAFATLARRHVDWVYSAARRRLGDAHLAEDVTQAVFLVVVRKPPRRWGRRSLAPWLFGILMRICKTTMRREASRRRRETEAAKMRATTAENAKPAEWDEIAPHLERLVARLRSSDREIILLRYYEQRGFAEIGQMLGVSEDAARMRVSRATNELGAMLSRKRLSMPPMLLASVFLANVVSPAPRSVAMSLPTGGMSTGSGTTINWLLSGPGLVATLAGAVVLVAVATGVIQQSGRNSNQASRGTPSTALERPTAEQPLPIDSTAMDYSAVQVVSAMKATLQQIHTLSASSTAESKSMNTGESSRVDYLFRFKRNPAIDPGNFDQFLVAEDRFTPGGSSPERAVMAYDGAKAYVLNHLWQHGRQSITGEVIPQLDKRFYGRGLTVAAISTHIADVFPIDRIVDNGTFRILGSAVVDGKPVLVIYGSSLFREDIPKEGSSGAYIRFFVRPDAGFMPVRQEWYAVTDQSPVGRLFEVYNATLEQDAASGVWFPTSGLLQQIIEGKVVSQSQIAVRDLQINLPLVDEDFKPMWPPGAMVIDKVDHTTFRVPTDARARN